MVGVCLMHHLTLSCFSFSRFFLSFSSRAGSASTSSCMPSPSDASPPSSPGGGGACFLPPLVFFAFSPLTWPPFSDSCCRFLFFPVGLLGGLPSSDGWGVRKEVAVM